MKKSIFLIIMTILSCFSYICLGQDLEAKIVNFNLYINNEEKQLSNPVVLLNDKTYVSLSEIAELLGNYVSWDSDNKSIGINSKSSSSLNSQHNNDVLYPYEEDGFWGYKDKEGNVVVFPEYFEANNFSNGLGLVRSSEGQDGNYGYINTKGEVVIPCIYPYAESFSDGVALVNVSNRTDTDMWKYIDINGNYISNNSFKLPHSFSEGYAVVLKEGYSYPVSNDKDIPKKWSYINKNGEFATDLTFDEAVDFCNGMAVVKNNCKFGIIDKNFNTLIDYKYDNIKILPDSDNEILVLNNGAWEKIEIKK